MHAKHMDITAPAQQLPAPAASQSYSYSNLEHDVSEPNVLAEEVALAIAYNGISQAVMLVTPTDLEDFIVGFSIGSGLIESPDEIYDIKPKHHNYAWQGCTMLGVGVGQCLQRWD